jgi:4'-phosphopantetheinyl transferase EntD
MPLDACPRRRVLRPGSVSRMAQSLQDLFTEQVLAVERRGDSIDESLLWPEEHAHLGEVAEGRRRDFVNGRWCAHQAIVALGHEPRPILAGEQRQPLWPHGLVGSITHTEGYVAAAVGARSLVASVGIDAEPDAPLPTGVLSRIGFDDELDWVGAGQAGMGVEHADRLLFCAKEAVYKAWHPVAERWLGFSEARLSFDTDAGRFEASIRVDGPIERMVGRYAAVDGFIVAAIELPAGESSGALIS